MYRFNFCILCVVLCSLTVLGEHLTTQKPVIIAVNPSTPNVPETAPSQDIPIKPEISSPKPTTTPPTPTTSPPTPPTTTSTTTTTTTVSPPTTSTTFKPTTTPIPPSTTTPTPKPKPVPAPQQGKWNYTTDNVTCIMVQFAAQLNVTYTNGSSAFFNVLLNVPENATVAYGNCNATEQSLKLTWPAGVVSNVLNNMTLFFSKNETTKTYQLKGINVTLAPEQFPNSSNHEVVELWHGAEWQTPLATSYRCGTPTQLNMTADARNVAATITLSQLQEEAFRTSKNGVFSAARECGGGDVPDAVPIAVGCALGGLVLVVLVAYLVGRRRSTSRGYLSM